MRRVDDGSEVRDVVHAEVGDGEGAALVSYKPRFVETLNSEYLVLLGCKLAVPGLLCQRLGLG